MARSAELIDPGGRAARGWRAGLIVLVGLTVLHVAGGLRPRRPAAALPLAVRTPLLADPPGRAGGLYGEARDAFWAFVAALRLPYYFRLGLVGFLGTLAWLIVPALLIAAGGRWPLLGIVGALLLAIVVPFLPFLQIRYALEGRLSALFSRRAIRERFRRARGPSPSR